MKSKRSKPALVAAILVSVAVGLYVVSGYFFGRAMTTAADVVYEMTNKNITWTGAGYSGIYGGNGR